MNMRMLLIFILSAILFSASAAPIDRTALYIDYRLIEYFNDFVDLCHEHGIEIEKTKNYKNLNLIIVGDVPIGINSGLVGCYFRVPKVIVIAPSQFEDTLILRATMYHELSHALLEYGHLCGFKHIMNPDYEKGDELYYREHWDELLDDLFKTKEYVKNKAYDCNNCVEPIQIEIFYPLPNHPPFIMEE